MIYNITICRYFHFQIQKKGLIIKITNIPNSNRLNNPFNNIECQEKLYHHSLQLDHVAIRQRSIRGLSVLFFLYFTFHFYNTIIRGLYSFQTVLQQRFRRCVNLRSDFRKSSQTACKGRQRPTNLPNASTKLQKRTSQTDASEQTTPTTTPTGKKTSTSSATPSAPQSSQKTSSWTIIKTWNSSRAELANKPSLTPTQKPAPNTSRHSKRHPHHHRHPRAPTGDLPTTNPMLPQDNMGSLFYRIGGWSTPPALKFIVLPLYIRRTHR